MYSENENFQLPRLPRQKLGNQPAWYRRWWGIMIVIFLTLVLIFCIAFAIYIGQLVYLVKTGRLAPEQILGDQSKESNNISLVLSESFTYGPKDAKVTIVEFGDYTCSACKQEYPVVKQLLKDYGDKVLFVYRDFPALQDNSLSVVLAVAANCAGQQGKFWEMHDRIFLYSGDLTEEALKTIAIQIGLDSLEFGSCLADQENLKRIELDLQQGYNLGVRGTPTFFVNGKMVAGALPFSLFETAITAALSQ